jgi:ribosome-associated toxin RatA of RatAB toxin-antitoxin module
MNKKMIFIIIGIALVAFIGFGLFKASQLQSINIVKSVTVKGTKEQVFDMVRYLNNFPKWSPFLAQDPTQKYEVKGTDGAVGAQYHWNGNKGKDIGYQEIVQIDSFRYIAMKCDIQKPFKAKPTFAYTFKETANGIEVTQDFKVQSGLIDAFFMWVFGAKAEMEKTNEQGMDLLKKAVEK